MQDLALALLNFTWLMIVQDSSLSRSLCRASALEGVDNSSQFSVIGKLTECSIESCAQVFNEDGEERRAKDGALQNPTRGQCQPDVTPGTVAICP